ELIVPVNDNPNAVRITTAFVYHSLEVPSGELIVASGTVLFVLDRHSLQYTTINTDSSQVNHLNSGLIKTARWDKRGFLWLGTKAGLEKLNWASREVQLFKPYPERPDLIDANVVN